MKQKDVFLPDDPPAFGTMLRRHPEGPTAMVVMPRYDLDNRGILALVLIPTGRKPSYPAGTINLYSIKGWQIVEELK